MVIDITDAHGERAQGMDLRGDRDGVGPRTGGGKRAGRDHLQRASGRGSFGARDR